MAFPDDISAQMSFQPGLVIEEQAYYMMTYKSWPGTSLKSMSSGIVQVSIILQHQSCCTQSIAVKMEDRTWNV